MDQQKTFFQTHVTASHIGTRVDRYLAEIYPTLSRTRIKDLIEAGNLLCHGQPLCTPSTPVREGMVLTLTIPTDPPTRPQSEQNIQFSILYEDKNLIVLDKPPGLVVHPAPGNETGTLVNGLMAHCGADFVGMDNNRPGIVHRLDKETSGVMVVAKTEKSYLALSKDFAARRIDRVYQALCWGVPSPAIGSFEGSIGRDKRNRQRMAITDEHRGKWALTHYKTLQVLSGQIAFVECRLATGRTHQIRVHFSAHGHPLVGDPLYLRRIPAVARQMPDTQRLAALDFPRQALHAMRLGFTHPDTGEKLTFETPLPHDMENLIKTLQ